MAKTTVTFTIAKETVLKVIGMGLIVLLSVGTGYAVAHNGRSGNSGPENVREIGAGENSTTTSTSLLAANPSEPLPLSTTPPAKPMPGNAATTTTSDSSEIISQQQLDTDQLRNDCVAAAWSVYKAASERLRATSIQLGQEMVDLWNGELSFEEANARTESLMDQIKAIDAETNRIFDAYVVAERECSTRFNTNG